MRFVPSRPDDTRLREQDLRDALANEALFVEYQPEFRLQSGDLAGFEALVRLKHPQRGVVPPDHFIPLAEQCGLIVPIGAFVLEAACRELSHWDSGSAAHLGIAVNVSTVQLERSDFVGAVKTALAAYGVDAGRLQLEITETAPMADRELVRSRITQLRELGVRVLLDDFGCGYMSLAHLATLPVDGLKIDKCFTAGLPDSPIAVAIVTCLMDLAHRLGLSIVVEGIENTHQAAWLEAFSGITVQGFLYGRPHTRLDTAQRINKPAH